ncbi:hypothetical protein SAMN05444157_0111 [Frankineae bacterium MT45]|nr:hypothetical protein SAMN05444157_0111 [Frankineae bacterium MT45]
MPQSTSRSAERPIAAVLLVLDSLALLYEMYAQALGGTAAFLDFFSYFTILSNLFAIIMLAIMLGDSRPLYWNLIRGAITSYMVFTSLINRVFLTSTPFDFTSNIPDTVLHVIAPLGVLWLWFAYPPRRVAWADIRYWYIFPVVYVIFTLLRGPGAGWYPYYFLDPRQVGGYPRVGISVALLMLLIGVVMLVVNSIGRIRSAR